MIKFIHGHEHTRPIIPALFYLIFLSPHLVMWAAAVGRAVASRDDSGKNVWKISNNIDVAKHSMVIFTELNVQPLALCSCVTCFRNFSEICPCSRTTDWEKYRYRGTTIFNTDGSGYKIWKMENCKLPLCFDFSNKLIEAGKLYFS